MDDVHPLAAEAGAVPAARRYVAQVLAGRELPPAAVADAQLVVTELATNALLHAVPPFGVLVRSDEDAIRVELHDGSAVGPVRALSGPDSMTGRGLGLVDAAVSRWGVSPLDGGGKVVWAEIPLPGSHRADRSGDSDASLAEWPEAADRPGETVYDVILGDVPTSLLISAKAHVDNIVRELTLAGSGALGGRTAALSPHLADLVAVVTTRFSEPRRLIKTQALKAAAAGAERTSLVLRLPASAAVAGRDYLAALDEVDSYARADRLLTLESLPEHRAFRRWYVTSLIDQLEHLSRGVTPPAPPSLERFLLDELGTVAAAWRAAFRAARLQSVTAALASAVTTEAVADAVLSEAVPALEAAGGGLLLATEHEQLVVPGTVGYEHALVDRLRAETRDEHLPAAEALRTGRPVWLESRAVLDAEFPEVRDLEPHTVSLCAVPLRVQRRVLGALRFSFDTPRLFDDAERAFIEALAAQAAIAVERSILHEAERAARSELEIAAVRLQRLHHVTASLAEARTENEVAAAVVAEAADTLGANVSALCVRDGDVLRIIGLGGARAGTRERWATFPVDADLPASEALRTGQAVVVGSRAEMEARYPSLAGHVAAEGPNISVPVLTGDEPIGTLSLRFPVDRVLDGSEVNLLSTIGRQCGIALERARLFDAERSASERATFLADAASVLGSSLEPADTLANLTGIFVPHFADYALVYLDEGNGHVELAAAAHRDPDLTPVMFDLQRRRPFDPSAPDGLAEVLRTGRTSWAAIVPDEVQERTAEAFDDDAVAGAFTPLSGVGVPLVAHDRVLGVMALVRTEGTPYRESDLSLIEEVAGRAAVAVDHAQTFRRERDAALTLQRSLLPQVLPQVPGVSFAWRYLPGAAGTHIGGDWYDVIPLEQGRVALVIGDVMGRGLRAAALMGQLRATARAYASTEVGPGEVLARLDAALARLEQDQITTVLFGLLDPTTRELTLATAGHLPPLLRSEKKAAYLDLIPGPPLGAGAAVFPELRVTVPSGSTLLLYTDGLVEDRVLPVDIGLEKLRAAVEDVQDPEEMCDRALAALGRDSQHDDDTAMLALQLAQ